MRAQRAPARLASRSGAGKPPGVCHRRGGRSPRPDPTRAAAVGPVRVGPGHGSGETLPAGGSCRKGTFFYRPAFCRLRNLIPAAAGVPVLTAERVPYSLAFSHKSIYKGSGLNFPQT